MPLSVMIKAALTPGSPAFMVLCVVAWLGIRFVWPRSRKLARIWMAGAVTLHLLLALPPVATRIAGALPASTPIDATTMADARRIVVLDGDNRVGRVRETLRLHRAAPGVDIFVLGQRWIADELVALGVPAARVARDHGPHTTRLQIEWLRQNIPEADVASTVLVASELQMPRVMGLLRAHALNLRPAVAPIDDAPADRGVRLFVPSYIALRTSRDALYEHAALAYYRWRGWTPR